MIKYIFVIFAAAPLTLKADVIKCSGNLGFWINTSLKKWERVEVNHKFIGHSSDFSAIHVGQYQKYPAIKIYPFEGISYEKISSEIKLATDNQSYFTITAEKNKKLHCEITNEAAF